MTATTLLAQDGKATTIKKTFSGATLVRITIQADPSIVWALLTNASDYPRWNSTIISISGERSQNIIFRQITFLSKKTDNILDIMKSK